MKTLCINIESDTESRRLSQLEFDRVGLTVEFVPAITGDNRPLAFNQSVYKCMDMAKGGSLLLFEDDVTFSQETDLKHRISYAIGAMPEGWLTLHLGANIIGTDIKSWQMPTAYSNNLAKLHNCWQSHATLYSAECVQYILDNFSPHELTESNPIFDEWLRVNVLPMGRSYVMKPMIAYQRTRQSAIWGHTAEYKHYHTKGNEYLKKI